MSMPMDVALAVARNRWKGAWVAEEWSIGHDGIPRRWCTVGEQSDEYSRDVLGAGQTFEAAFVSADERLPQRRGGKR